MTLPIERTWAVINTEDFLYDLMDPKKTPRVPKDVRRRARALLKHYPSKFYLEQASKKASDVFGVTTENYVRYRDTYLYVHRAGKKEEEMINPKEVVKKILSTSEEVLSVLFSNINAIVVILWILSAARELANPVRDNLHFLLIVIYIGMGTSALNRHIEHKINQSKKKKSK